MSANHTTHLPDPYDALDLTLHHIEGARVAVQLILYEAPPQAAPVHMSALQALIEAQRLMVLQGIEQLQTLREGGEV